MPIFDFGYLECLVYLEPIWTPIWTPVTSWGAIIKKKETKQDKFYRDPKLLKKLKQLDHLKDIEQIEINRSVEIGFFYKNKHSTILMKSEDGDEFFTYDDPPKARLWFLDHLDIGLQLIKYITKKDDLILFEILKKYPDMRFDDGTRINISLWIATTQNQRERLIKRLLIASTKLDTQDSKNVWIRQWINILTLTTYNNPIFDQVIKWAQLTKYGLPDEKQKARKLLEELKLDFIIPYSNISGRSTIELLDHPVITRYKQDNPLITPLELKQEQAYCINKTYNTVLAEIQEIFNDNKRSDKRSKAFKDYIKRENMTMKLAKKLFPKQFPHTNKSEETFLNEVTEELLFKTVKYQENRTQIKIYPKDIAWQLLEAEFSASKKTLQRLKSFWKPEKLIDALPADIREEYGTKMIKDLFDIDVKYTKKS